MSLDNWADNRVDNRADNRADNWVDNRADYWMQKKWSTFIKQIGKHQITGRITGVTRGNPW